MSLSIELDRKGDQAIYRQIAEQIKTQINDGRLPSRTQLPTVRQLADQLGVTRLTIQNAYGELQSDGWVEATIGRGTFVSDMTRPRAFVERMIPDPNQQLTADSVINNMIQIYEWEAQQVTGVRSMAVASPDPRLFDAHLFWNCLEELRPDLIALSGYGSPQGDVQLRIEMVGLLEKRGLTVTPEDVMITSGLTHGLALVAQALCQAGDHVLVEQPTYLGFLNILKAQKLQPIGIPLDEEGPHLEALERAVVQYRPRFFYTISSFQNPTGICASPTRRKKLLEMAKRYGFMLIEDDIYAPLAYEEPAPPPIKSMDRSGSVIYLTSESKVFMPGLRIGSIVAPLPLRERLLTLRRATDLCNPPLMQRALALFLRKKGMQQHLKRVLPIYRRRRDAMLWALRRYMPPEVSWTEPKGGFCCWLTMPSGHALRDVHRAALEKGLAVAPGEVFLTQPGTHQHVRLSFSNQSEEAIRSGVELLASIISERLAQEKERNGTLIEWTPLV